MKIRPTQFGERENTASARQHASRPAVESLSSLSATQLKSSHLQETSLVYSLRAGEDALGTPSKSALLNVQQVAELLQVPVSWVYERVRKRSLERLPGYRLGKYWRFRESDIQAWIDRQRMGARFNA
jgi:excisionase family DNA binding protein